MDFSLALKDDGSVVAWGCGGSFVPAQCVVPAAAASGVDAIAAGNGFALALKAGGVIGWGCGGIDFGECTVPAAAQSGVVAIAAGGFAALALKEEGSVISWGCAQPGSDEGQCTVPPAATSGVVAIAAGFIHDLALKRDGSVVAWGCGPQPTSFSPACDVPAPAGSGVTAIAAGSDHSLALETPSPQSLAQDALAATDELAGGATGADVQKLRGVVANLSDAADPSLWVDGAHLVSKQGARVFDSEQAAVGTLAELLRTGALEPAVVQGAIDEIEESCRLLASTALSDAAASGNPQQLADGRDELARADQALADARLNAAVAHYRNAWTKAQTAAL
jgi:hypothetical protein